MSNAALSKAYGLAKALVNGCWETLNSGLECAVLFWVLQDFSHFHP